MTAVQHGTIRIRTHGISSREVGGELVVLDLDNSRYLSVRGSGIVLFGLLQNECSRADLVAALLAEFEVDEDTASRDVDTFLGELSSAGLLDTMP